MPDKRLDLVPLHHTDRPPGIAAQGRLLSRIGCEQHRGAVQPGTGQTDDTIGLAGGGDERNDIDHSHSDLIQRTVCLGHELQLQRQPGMTSQMTQ